MGSAEKPVIATQHGWVRGLVRDGIMTFLGLPYAAPPVGDARFRPPGPPAPWTGVRDVLNYGASCPHISRLPPGRTAPSWLDGPDLRMDEDCLFLNVWTPGLEPGRKAPVMVWLHTGGFVNGSGSPPLFAGDRLARRGDVVVVTLNHRLGALGFLALGGLADGYEGAANAGMLDIVAALEWVRDNISAFGGDPDCVTIFGESGGGLKVSTLLAMPAAQGLFHRAIIQSGARVFHMEAERAREATARLVDRLGFGADPMAGLRSVAVKDLLAAQSATAKSMPSQAPGFPHVFSPSLDGAVLPRHPFSPDAPLQSADVPIMVGYNRTEATYFHRLNYGPNDPDMTLAAAEARLRPVMGEDTGDILRAFGEAFPQHSPFETYIEAFTAFPTAIYTQALAGRKAAAGRAPAFVYRFDWSGSIWSRTPGAPHMIELPFVFDAVDRAPQMVPDTPLTRSLAAQVSEAWCAFARTGSPKAAGWPEWEPYDQASPMRLLIDEHSRMAPDLGGAPRAALARALAI